jgi:hypothetical protein
MIIGVAHGPATHVTSGTFFQHLNPIEHKTFYHSRNKVTKVMPFSFFITLIDL